MSREIISYKYLLEMIGLTLDSMEKRKDHSLEKKFMLVAERDLKISELLFENEWYPEAVYHLHQAVEKTAKALFLYLGFISERKLKSIGHKSPKLFLNLMNEKIGQIALNMVQQYDPLISRKEDDYRKLVTEQGKTIAVTDYESFESLFSALRGVEEQVNKQLEPLRKVLHLPKDMSFEPLMFVWLYILSSLIFPHYEYTKYPDQDITPFEYTDKMGIVRALPELQLITKRCLTEVSAFIG